MTVTVCLHILSIIRTWPFSLESSGLTVASLKTFDNSAGCKVLNFQIQIQRQLCLKGRWILLKGETKGLKRHGVTLFLFGQDAREHSECTGNCSYESCACPMERGLVPSRHISQVIGVLAEQETRDSRAVKCRNDR